MGDMADYIIDSWFWDDPDNPNPLYDLGGLLTCKYCGEEGLHWEKHTRKWRLANANRKIHDCRMM